MSDKTLVSFADLVVEDEQGAKYIKACFNSCRLIVDNVSSNQDYSTIKKIFHINYYTFLLRT